MFASFLFGNPRSRAKWPYEILRRKAHKVHTFFVCFNKLSYIYCPSIYIFHTKKSRSYNSLTWQFWKNASYIVLESIYIETKKMPEGKINLFYIVIIFSLVVQGMFMRRRKKLCCIIMCILHHNWVVMIYVV